MSRDLVLRDGARGVTVDRIVAASGAPKGSIYHRFSTVNDLLAAMWLRGVRRSQARFLEPLGVGGDPEAPPPAWPSTTSHGRSPPTPGSLLRREDLVGAVLDATLAADLQRVNDQLHAALTALARRLYGRATRDAVERTMLRWSISRRGDPPPPDQRNFRAGQRPVPTGRRDAGRAAESARRCFRRRIRMSN